MHISNLPPLCSQGENSELVPLPLNMNPSGCLFFQRDIHLHQNLLSMAAAEGVGNSLGKLKGTIWLHRTALVWIRSGWLRLRLSGGMTLPYLSSLESRKATGEEAWQLAYKEGGLPSVPQQEECRWAHLPLQLSGGYHTQKLMPHPPQTPSLSRAWKPRRKVWVSVRGSPETALRKVGLSGLQRGSFL